MAFFVRSDIDKYLREFDFEWRYVAVPALLSSRKRALALVQQL